MCETDLFPSGYYWFFCTVIHSYQKWVLHSLNDTHWLIIQVNPWGTMCNMKTGKHLITLFTIHHLQFHFMVWLFFGVAYHVICVVHIKVSQYYHLIPSLYYGTTSVPRLMGIYDSTVIKNNWTIAFDYPGKLWFVFSNNKRKIHFCIKQYLLKQ